VAFRTIRHSLLRVIFPSIGLRSYGLLLGSLGLLFFVAPLLTHVRMGRFRLSDFMSLAILLVGVWAVARSRVAVLVLSSLAIVAIVFHVLDHFSSGDVPRILSTVASGLFLVALFAIIAVDLFRTSEVTGSTLAAACSGYVLIAGIFAAIFSLMITFDPQAVTLWPGAGFTVSEIVFQQDRYGVLGYFSIVTLTTLGYGDIVPNSTYTRSIGALEAVIGQLYLAVIVARLVGMYIAGRSSQKKAAFKFD
jgi:hypothetical protein